MNPLNPGIFQNLEGFILLEKKISNSMKLSWHKKTLDGSMKGNMKLNLEEIATKGFLMEMGSTIIGLSNQKKLPQNFPLEGPRRGPQITPGGPWGVNFKKKIL